MIIEKEELTSLIQHRNKMLLITRVKEYDLKEGSLYAEFQVSGDDLFFDPALNAVPSWVGFEYIAQAISALSGLRFRERGEEPKIGFILSVSALQIEIPAFKAGSVVEVKIKETNVIDEVYSFLGEVFLGGKKAAEGKLTVMDANDEQVKALKEGKA